MGKNLKEFEKWYEKEKQRRCDAPMYSTDYRTGWIAALVWLRDNREGKVWDDVDDMIKKELGN